MHSYYFRSPSFPTWTPTHEERWAATFAQLKAQHTGLLIGTTIPVPNTQANRNVLLSRGYTERLSYVQRVPVPLGMWHFGDEHNGFPLMLRYPSTIRIWDRRAGVLICYEQLLVWPALQTLSRNPDMLLPVKLVLGIRHDHSVCPARLRSRLGRSLGNSVI